MISVGKVRSEFADLYQSDARAGGKPPKAIRLMIGLLLLQHLHNISDERVLRGWLENHYWGCCINQLFQNGGSLNDKNLISWKATKSEDLQQGHNLSDEQVVRGLVENPYWQHFCGYDFLQ